LRKFARTSPQQSKQQSAGLQELQQVQEAVSRGRTRWQRGVTCHMLFNMTSTMIISATSTGNGRDPQTGRFLTAVNGNIGGPGRKIGSRNLLTTQFLDDLRTTWATHGRSALERCAIEEPAQFVRIVAGLLPREAYLNVEHSIFADISDYAQAFSMAVGVLKNDPPPLPLLTENNDDAG